MGEEIVKENIKENNKDNKTAGKAVFKPVEDILICMGITFAISVLSYEKYMPENMMKIYLPLIFAAFALTWAWSALSNGYRKSRAFPFLTVFFWLAPEALFFLSENGPMFLRLSSIYLFLADCSKLIVSYPETVISGLFNVSAFISSIIISVFFLLLYAGGFISQKSGLKFKSKT